MLGYVNRKVTNKDVQIQNRLVDFTRPPIETGDLNVKRDLYVSGTIHYGKFLPGQVANTLMLSNTDLGQTGKSITASSTITVFNYNYTPVTANSYLSIEYQTIYSLIGSGSDSVEAYLYVTDLSDNRIGKTYQQWNSFVGGGTRSGTMFPIVGRYTNMDTSVKNIRVDIYNHTDADTITVNSDISTWLKITEIGR